MTGFEISEFTGRAGSGTVTARGSVGFAAEFRLPDRRPRDARPTPSSRAATRYRRDRLGRHRDHQQQGERRLISRHAAPARSPLRDHPPGRGRDRRAAGRPAQGHDAAPRPRSRRAAAGAARPVQARPAHPRRQAPLRQRAWGWRANGAPTCASAARPPHRWSSALSIWCAAPTASPGRRFDLDDDQRRALRGRPGDQPARYRSPRLRTSRAPRSPSTSPAAPRTRRSRSAAHPTCRRTNCSAVSCSAIR